MKILNRYTREVIASFEQETLAGSALVEVDFAGAYLRGMDLSETKLQRADLTGADLRDARLNGGNLSYAKLGFADLDGADLSEAQMQGAGLMHANLKGTIFTGANLFRVSLGGATLADANWTEVRSDFWEVLTHLPAEVPGLLEALHNGRVNGSTYTGQCACLITTLARCAGWAYNSIPGLMPDASRPAERFFLGIKQGDTPQNSQICALAAQWTEEWIAQYLVKKIGED